MTMEHIRRFGFLALVLTGLMVSCSTPIPAGPGDGSGGLPEAGVPDPAFGDDYDGDGIPDGWRTVGLAGADLRVRDATLDASGRIVAVGGLRFDDDPAWRMTLWRFLPDGSPDPGFGDDYDGDGIPDGYVYFSDADVRASMGNALKLHSGWIYVTGWLERASAADGKDVALWRFGEDGRPDPTFHFAAPAMAAARSYLSEHDLAGGGADEEGLDLALDTEVDWIFVTGYSRNPDGNRSMVVWAVGPDTIFVNPVTYRHWVTAAAFGTGGVFVYSSSTGDAVGRALGYFAGDDLRIAGWTWGPSGTRDLAVWGVTADGRLVEDFPASGSSAPFVHHGAAGGAGADYAMDLIPAPDGAYDRWIAVGGSANPWGSSDAVAWRLGADEHYTFRPLSGPTPPAVPFGPDATGYTVLRSPDRSVQEAVAVASDPGGALFLTGWRGTANENLMLWKLDGDGIPKAESAFRAEGVGGYVGVAVLPAAAGRVTVVAGALVGGREALLLVRYR